MKVVYSDYWPMQLWDPRTDRHTSLNFLYDHGHWFIIIGVPERNM